MDIDEWKKNSQLAKFLGLAVVVLSSVYGAFMASVQIWDRFLLKPEPIVAEIVSVDFQPTKYIEISTDLVNPSKEPATFRNVGVECSMASGDGMVSLALNNYASRLPGLSSLEKSPINLPPGVAKNIQLVFMKSSGIDLSQQCESLSLVWVASSNKFRTGGQVRVPKNAVTFSSLSVGQR